jgi:hypothetical protein
MSRARIAVEAGQEWERRNTKGPRVTYVRVVSVGQQYAVVESWLESGVWGMRRRVLLSAFTNTPGGYTLVEAES